MKILNTDQSRCFFSAARQLSPPHLKNGMEEAEAQSILYRWSHVDDNRKRFHLVHSHVCPTIQCNVHTVYIYVLLFRKRNSIRYKIMYDGLHSRNFILDVDFFVLILVFIYYICFRFQGPSHTFERIYVYKISC